MRTAKNLLPSRRQIFHPELLCCPHCGGELKLCNYLTWDKTVQTLSEVLSIASRPSHCVDANCAGFLQRFVSAEGQQIALPGSTYGLDVVVRIGWLRQEGRYTFAEIQGLLAGTIQISLTHLRHIYQRVYLPLLACDERQHKDKLDKIAKEQGGLIITLDGLVPEGGQPQIWFMRELSTGLTLRSGWIGTFDKDTFVDFLLPLGTLEWPILAVLSDKQKGLLPAMAEVLPNTPHQLCQPHFLRNLAEPLSSADSSFKVSLRKSVRNEVGQLIRSERVINNSQSRLLTMTGLFPDNEGLKSESEEAKVQNNGNKSEACCTPQSTESVDYGLPDKEAGQSTQPATLQTNNEDKDGDILTAQVQASQIIEKTNTNSQPTSKSKDSPSITVEISKDTTEKKENDTGINHHQDVINTTTITVSKEPNLADGQQSAPTACDVEQITPNWQAKVQIPVQVPQISSQNNTSVTTIKTAQSQFEQTAPDVGPIEQSVNGAELEQTTSKKRASASQTAVPCKESQSDALWLTPLPIKTPPPELSGTPGIPPEAKRLCSKSASNSKALETASTTIEHDHKVCDLAESSRRQQTDVSSSVTDINKAPDSELLNDATTNEPPIIKTNAVSTAPVVDSQATNEELLANQVIIQIMRHVRYLLTLKGRPPKRKVGIFMYQRLLLVIELLDDLLAHRYDYYLKSLREGLKTALAPYREQFNELKLASTWMDEISNILEPVALGRSSEEVANQLHDYLNQRLSENHENEFLMNFVQHLDKVSTSYWPGLFHTYDCEFLPRSNNELESHFRDTQRRLLRTTGQKGLTKRILHRYGAWELLPRPPTEAERLERFLQISHQALKIEQKRLAEHLRRFDMDTRSPNLLDAKFQKLRNQWFNLRPDTAG